MAHIRSSNGGGHLGLQGRIPAVLEMAALDDLGPKAKFAIVNGPMPLLAYPIVSQIVEANDKIYEQNVQLAEQGLPQKAYIDPKHPWFDQAIARSVLDENVRVMQKDRSIDFCLQGMKPLRSRINPKTLREERKARRVRW